MLLKPIEADAPAKLRPRLATAAPAERLETTNDGVGTDVPGGIGVGGGVRTCAQAGCAKGPKGPKASITTANPLPA